MLNYYLFLVDNKEIIIIINNNFIFQILWVITRFFLLSAEMSVVTFGLAFGHLDSRNSIKAVLICTGTIALGFTLTQGNKIIYKISEKLIFI